jgi:precorrin-4 methylase
VAVARATRPDEATIRDTIANMPTRIAAERPGTPLLVIIGSVLAQRQRSSLTRRGSATAAQ